MHPFGVEDDETIPTKMAVKGSIDNILLLVKFW